MKQYFYFFVTIALLLAGCGGKPERKKLPDLSIFPGWEETPLDKAHQGLLFTGDTSLEEGSRLTCFSGIALPDPAFDSLTVAMVRGYGPLAETLFSQWETQVKKGVLIDLRSGPGVDYFRADFAVSPQVSGNAKTKVSVVFIWDRPSANRAGYLIEAMESVSEINCILVADSRHTGGLPRTDCFSPSPTGYEGK
jgi:hypothetical protein